MLHKQSHYILTRDEFRKQTMEERRQYAEEDSEEALQKKKKNFNQQQQQNKKKKKKKNNNKNNNNGEDDDDSDNDDSDNDDDDSDNQDLNHEFEFENYIDESTAIEMGKKYLDRFNSYEINKEKGIIDLDFSLAGQSGKVFVTEVIKEALMESHVRSVTDINHVNCIPLMNDNTRLQYQIEGFNFHSLQKINESFDILDFKTITTNNVHHMVEYYGIEAAREFIVQEVKNVFAMYGMEVNERHIGLIADFMTYRGEYHPCNRHSYNFRPSPFHKLSFEQACVTTVKSASRGECDPLVSPSSRLAFGQTMKLGTGSFDLKQLN
jgi:DNA-directed RNA polymerase I subunit RPA1